MKTQKATTKAKKEAKATKKAIKSAKALEATKQAKESRAGSKKEIVLKLLRREGGATLADLAKATEWQNHSIRGFLSAQVGKKMGLKLESTKDDGGERSYRIVS